MALLLAAAARPVQRATLDEAERLWAAARERVVSPPAPGGAAEALPLLSLWRRWREAAARDPGAPRVPCFVAACAIRMAALDAATGAADEVRAGGGGELVAPFKPPASNAAATELVRAGERDWHSGSFDRWNEVAYAVCFAAEQHVQLDEGFLAACAAFDADCAARDALHSELAAAPGGEAPPTPPAAAAAAADWVRRLTTNASDDVYALVREARAWAFLTPAAERGSAGTPSSKLAHRGVSAEGEPRTDAAFLFLFDYAMRQLLDTSFFDLFFASDYDAAGALRKIEALRCERLAKPPPLVVHCAARWHVVYRDAGGARAVGRVEAHDTAAGALLAWMEHVMTVRGGRMFLGKRLDALHAEVAIERPQEDAPIVAQTDALVW